MAVLRQCARFAGLAAVLWMAADGSHAATFDDLASEAAAARRANRIPEAIELYRQAVGMRGSWLEGWWFLGTLSYASYHFGDCETAFDEFVKLDDKRPLAWSLLGLCEFETGHYDPALGHLQRGLASGDLPPDVEPGVRFHYGLLLSRAGLFEQGKRQLERYAQGGAHEPLLIAALGLNALHQRLLPKEVPPDRMDAVQQAGEAERLLILGRKAEGGAALQALVKQYPKLSGVHYLYGTYLASSDTQASIAEFIAEFRLELQTNPDDPDTNAMLALMLERTHDVSAALPFARKAAAAKIPDALGQYVYGEALRESGDVQAAVPRLEEAVHMDSTVLLYHIALATAYSQAGRAQDARRERLASLDMAMAGQSPAGSPQTEVRARAVGGSALQNR